MKRVWLSDQMHDGRHIVDRAHFAPQLLSEEDLVGSIEVQEIPDMLPYAKGKYTALVYDEPTNSVLAVYAPRPLTSDEENEELRVRLAAAENAILELLLSGGVA